MATAFEPVKMVSVAGASFAYREEGEGEPVVFVHGDISDLRTWGCSYPLSVLGTGRSPTAAGTRGRTRTSARGVDDQMLAHVDDFVALLRAICAVPAHLVGNSLTRWIGSRSIHGSRLSIASNDT